MGTWQVEEVLDGQVDGVSMRAEAGLSRRYTMAQGRRRRRCAILSPDSRPTDVAGDGGGCEVGKFGQDDVLGRVWGKGGAECWMSGESVAATGSALERRKQSPKIRGQGTRWRLVVRRRR